LAQFCGYALIEGFCSGPAKLGMTVGQSVCCGSRPWDTRRVARLDGRKVFAARVGSVADGRGVVSLDNVLLYGATDRPRSCSGVRANATGHQHDSVGLVDKVWCKEIGVWGAGDDGY